jgi:hypothetical protein
MAGYMKRVGKAVAQLVPTNALAPALHVMLAQHCNKSGLGVLHKLAV